MSDNRWHQRQSDGRDVWTNQSLKNPAPVQLINQSGSTNSVVSVLTYAGDEVIPIPDCTTVVTVTPSQTVVVTTAHEALPAIPNVQGVINGPNTYTCVAGVATSIPIHGDTNYNAMRITGAKGTRSVIGFTGGAVSTKGSVLAGFYLPPVRTDGLGEKNGPDERFNYSNQTRVRQDGNITGIKIYRILNTGVSESSIAIWRKVGTSYRLVGRSENFISKTLNVDAVQTIMFDTPIYGVRQGDFISVRHTGNLLQYGAHILSINAGLFTYDVVGSAYSYDGIEWAAQHAGPGYLVVAQVLMEAPSIVGIGDSLISNTAYGAAFAQPGGETVVPVPRSTVIGYCSELLGSKYFQNMGVAGEMSNLTAARFAADCVALKPDYAVILVGANDIGTTISSTRRESTETLATVTAPGHQLKTGDVVNITGFTNAQFNVNAVPVTVTSTSVFTYPLVGASVVADGADTGGKITLTDPATHVLANYNSMMAACVAAGVKPVIITRLPWTGASNVKNQRLDVVKTGLLSLASTHGAITVDALGTLGQDRTAIHSSFYSRAHVHKTIANFKRVANVATVETTTAHGLNSGDRVIITAVEDADGVDTSFNSADATVTVVDTLHFTYPSTGTAKVETVAVAGDVEYAVATISIDGSGLVVGDTIDVSEMVDSTFDRTGATVTYITTNGVSFNYNSFGSDVVATEDTGKVGTVTCSRVLVSGNKWDYIPAYDSGDGIHMNAAGNQKLGELVANAIKAYEGGL